MLAVVAVACHVHRLCLGKMEYGVGGADWPALRLPEPRPTEQFSMHRTSTTSDSTTFNTWFTAYVAGDTTAEAVAIRALSAPQSRLHSTRGWPPIPSRTRAPLPDPSRRSNFT